MLIGEDFDKIVWQPYGFDFVEPNTMIGDTLIFVVSLIVGILALRIDRNRPFFNQWKRFFFVFSITFLVGGFGHLFFNYWGVPGKYPSWYLGVLTTYLVEQAMLSIHQNPVWRYGKRILYFISGTKFGHLEGRHVTIIKALYGLKNSSER